MNLFLFVILLSAGFFGIGKNSLASEEDLIITEIMYDPEGNNSKHSKWIEIYNSGEEFTFQTKKSGDSYKLLDFYTCDNYRKKKNDIDSDKCVEHSITTKEPRIILKSKDFLIVTTDVENFKNDYTIESEILKSSMSLSSNSPSFTKLCFQDDDHCSSLRYSDYFKKKTEGYSLEKINFDNDNSQKNWQESYEFGGTPGKESSKRKIYPKKIWINEILPNPEGDDTKEEFIELFNSEDKDVNLTNWSLEDLGGHKFTFSKKYCEEDKNKCLIESDKFLVIKSENYSSENLSLNNSNGDTLFLFDPNNDEVSNVSYSNANEAVSYNFDGKKWRWSKDITPGKENKFNKLPKIKVDINDKVYVDIYADFEVKVNDPEKEKVKVTWDFGDGHKSYKKETRHKYEKKGKYKLSVKIFDGSEEVIKEYKIEVKKFPHREVKIRTLCPNPAGDDSENEWILVKNYSDDEINLKGWSVATGSKKLYNHPIYEDIEIKKGKTAKITREDSHFTLNNEKSKVELRYPDSKEAYEVKYDKGDDNTAEEDEIYEKTDGGWRWTKTQKNIETEQQSNTETEVRINEAVEEENFEEFLGGQSIGQNKDNRMNELVNYGVKIRLANYNIGNNQRVLGVSTRNYNEPIYHFTENTSGEHYAIKFFKNLLSAINYFVNKLVNDFY